MLSSYIGKYIHTLGRIVSIIKNLPKQLLHQKVWTCPVSGREYLRVYCHSLTSSSVKQPSCCPPSVGPATHCLACRRAISGWSQVTLMWAEGILSANSATPPHHLSLLYPSPRVQIVIFPHEFFLTTTIRQGYVNISIRQHTLQGQGLSVALSGIEMYESNLALDGA